jgi:hypothetical protein
MGACAATLMPLVLLIRAHMFAAERIQARRDHRSAARPRASATAADYGPTCATIGSSAAPIIRRRHSSSTTLADSVYAAIPRGPIVGSTGIAEAEVER